MNILMTNGQNENIEFGITLAEKQISCKKKIDLNFKVYLEEEKMG